MSRDELIAHWNRVETLLLSARAQLEDVLVSAEPAVDTTLFQEFIDHNELGLAYEELVGVCRLLSYEPPHDLLEVGRMMGRNP